MMQDRAITGSNTGTVVRLMRPARVLSPKNNRKIKYSTPMYIVTHDKFNYLKLDTRDYVVASPTKELLDQIGSVGNSRK